MAPPCQSFLAMRRVIAPVVFSVAAYSRSRSASGASMSGGGTDQQKADSPKKIARA